MDNRLKIINYLGKNTPAGYTMHGLSNIVKIPYASFYRTILGMKELLIVTTIGKSKVIRINLNNKIITSYLAISSYEEKKEFLKKHIIIKKIAEELETTDIVLLFGSYAKGKETEKSDLDLLIINKTGKKTLFFSKYELLFKKTINPIFITTTEFKNMLKDKEENVGKQAVKNHIVLNNPEDFWGCVLDAV